MKTNAKKNLTLAKMLSPEEMALLGTMQSTLNELLSLQQGGTIEQPEGEQPAGEIMEALKKLAAQSNLGDNAEEAGDESTNVQDESVKKEDNGRTANENAEERTNPTTDINDKNLSEVGKAILSLLAKSKVMPIAKSQQNYNNSNADIIVSAITKALNPLVKKVEGIEQFNSNILDALGFVEKIEKSQSLQQVNKSQGNKPVQNIDATGVVNELVNVIKSMAQNQQSNHQFKNDWNGAQETRKNLETALPLIFQNALANQNKK